MMNDSRENNMNVSKQALMPKKWTTVLLDWRRAMAHVLGTCIILSAAAAGAVEPLEAFNIELFPTNDGFQLFQ
jgi:hypothetical protein